MPAKREQKAALPPLTVQSEKKWYSTGVQLCVDYLKSLLMADELFDNGILQILHWSTQEGYHKSLFKGEWNEGYEQPPGVLLELGAEPVPVALADKVPGAGLAADGEGGLVQQDAWDIVVGLSDSQYGR